MKRIFFSDNSLVPDQEIKIVTEKLSSEKKRMKNGIQDHYKTEYASLYAPFDQDMREMIKKEIVRVSNYSPALIVVIGIGGSNLGTKAIWQAMLSYCGTAQKIEVCYADTVDPEFSACLVKKVESMLIANKTVALVVATKSGTTTETIANFELLLGVLKKYRPDNYSQLVTIITDHQTPLHDIAMHHNFGLLNVPKKVGGRFSTLSAVGLFPLGLMGIAIDALCDGAVSIIRDEIIDEKTNDIARSAAINYWHYINGKPMRDIFLFSVLLEGIGHCYRQYIGESLGKQFDMQKKEVRVGITPLVSIGTIDLHSVGQLYYGGPRDKNTTFITVKKMRADVHVPQMNEFDSCVKNIQGISFSAIMNAVISGVKDSYKNEGLPFTSLELPEISSFYLGQLLQFAMIETMFIGHLLNINPFDQPHVELYKQETRKILAHE
ncbi:MAG TPA: hypothetical protein VHO47_05550 [Candidatus Babeliales bacterium]|nr:hypothetical protein [Candidatus Babeliales bacterium]